MTLKSSRRKRKSVCRGDVLIHLNKTELTEHKHSHIKEFMKTMLFESSVPKMWLDEL